MIQDTTGLCNLDWLAFLWQSGFPIGLVVGGVITFGLCWLIGYMDREEEYE